MKIANFPIAIGIPFLFAFLFATSLFSQSNLQQPTSVNADGSAPAASAILDVQATDKGMLVPRMTSAQRTAIASPANGLLVFDTTTGGFWFYNGTAWRRITDDSQGNGGKTYFILSGNVSNAEATQRIQNDIGVNTQFVWIQNTTQLTALNLPNLTQSIEIRIQNNAALVTATFPDLTDVLQDVTVNGNPNLTTLAGLPALTSTGNIRVNNNAALTAVSLPALTATGDFSVFDNAVLTTMSLPALTSTGNFGVFSNSTLTSLSLPALTAIGDFSINNNAALTALSLPVLTASAGSFNVYSNAALTALSLPALTASTGSFGVSSNGALAALSLPALATATGGFNVYNNAALTALSLPALTTFSGDFYAQHNALSSSSVNGLLAYFVSIVPNITGKVFMFHNQSPSAPPTGQGITDKDTLIANGNSVYTD